MADVGAAVDDPGEDSGRGDDEVLGEDELVDEMSKESFPTSDPPSTWAGPDEPQGGSDSE